MQSGACSMRTKRPRGFTLIEILVVLVIVGIIASIATLSVGVLGRDSELQDQARRFAAIVRQTKEEIELQGREVGVFVERDGYTFMRYDALSQAWIEVDNDELMAARTLPEGLAFRLWLESREVQLKTHEENRAAFDREDAKDKDDDKKNKDENRNKDPRTPQIALLSSGDTTPFELHLQREGSRVRWRIASQPDNTLIAEAMEDE